MFIPVVTYRARDMILGIYLLSEKSCMPTFIVEDNFGVIAWSKYQQVGTRTNNIEVR